MSHVVVVCPGCQSKLRFRTDTGRTHVECPRCGEILDVPRVSDSRPATPSVTKPAPQQRPRTAAAAPERQPAAGDSVSRGRRQSAAAAGPAAARRASSRRTDRRTAVEQQYDEDELRARRETKLFFIGIAGAVLVALIAFPGAWYLLWGNDDDAAVAQQSAEPDSVTQSGSLSMIPTLPQPNAGVSTSQGDLPDSNPDSNTVAVKPDQALTTAEPPAATSVPGNAVAAAEIPDAAIPTPTPAPAPVPGGGITPPATFGAEPLVPVAGPADGQLKYGWKSGDQHVYQITVEADFGSEKRTVNGACTYTVSGSAGQAGEDVEGSGTGFVVSANGIIATCAHVTQGARRIEAVINGKTYPARLLAEKKKEDLALLQIDARGLPVVQLGNSDQVQLAQDVRAIGFPLSDVLGTGVKITSGTVAGIVEDPVRGRRFHIDAPINPGNSGGPVVNGAGQVVGVASAKLSGSAISSVGFAVPINELQTMLAGQGLNLPLSGPQPDLPGTEMAQKVIPSVVYLKVWGTGGGDAFHVDFTASFSETSRVSGGRMRFGSFPSFPTSSSDRGRLTVDSFGDVSDYTGEEHLPFVLGPIGRFFIEPLDPYGSPQWETEYETTLQRIEQQERAVPFGPPRGMRPRFGPRGFSPFEEPEEKTVDVIPAIERTTYRLGQELNQRITIHKQYDFTTTRDSDRPYMKIQGQGELVFDRAVGMPVSLDYQGTLEQNDTDGTTVRLPVKITYVLRDPEEVQREREEAQRRHEERQQQLEHERTVPDPQLVDAILEEVRKAEGGIGAFAPLKRLSEVAVVDERRDRVLQVIASHRKNSNSSVRNYAIVAFCHWATDDQVDELQQILADPDPALYNARKAALARLAALQQPELLATIIDVMLDLSLRNDAKTALLSAGEAAEDPILKKLDSISDQQVQRDLIEVLQKHGTQKSVPVLERIRDGGNILLKHSAERALDAIRARL